MNENNNQELNNLNNNNNMNPNNNMLNSSLNNTETGVQNQDNVNTIQNVNTGINVVENQNSINTMPSINTYQNNPNNMLQEPTVNTTPPVTKKKSNIVLIIIIILLVLGGITGAYFMLKPGSNSNSSSTTNDDNKANSNNNDTTNGNETKNNNNSKKTKGGSLIELPTGKTKDNLEVGDEVCINGDTTECFNFIGYDGNDVKLLSKYNLKVGNINDGSFNLTGRYSSSDTGYGLQSSETRGWVRGASSYNGTVAFSATKYWDAGSNLKSKYGSSYPADVYDTDYKTAPDFTTTGFKTAGYSIAYYVEEYKNILTRYGVTIKDARLLTYAEATDSSIGCDGSNHSCPTTGFITNTSFWLGSARDYEAHLWFVYPGGTFYGENFYIDYYCGVRPVVIISKSDI